MVYAWKGASQYASHRQLKIFFALLKAPIARITQYICFITMQQRLCLCDVVNIGCRSDQGVNTNPDCASTPICAFIPKNHWLPFFVWCISLSCFLSLFLVEEGAVISVASTIAPSRRNNSRSVGWALIAFKMDSVRWCSSSRWRNLSSVVASGGGLAIQVNANKAANCLIVVYGIFGTFIRQTEALLCNIHFQYSL